MPQVQPSIAPPSPASMRFWSWSRYFWLLRISSACSRPISARDVVNLPLSSFSPPGRGNEIIYHSLRIAIVGSQLFQLFVPVCERVPTTENVSESFATTARGGLAFLPNPCMG